MKKILLTALLAALGYGGYAQGITLGVTTGVNNTYVLDKGLSEDPRYASQGTYNWAPIGMSVGLNLTPRFGLQLEAIKNTAGQVYNIVDIYENRVGKREMVMNYLSLPLLLKFMDNEMSKTANINFMIGPQLSLLTSGYESIQYHSADMEIPENSKPPAGATPNEDGSYSVPAQEYAIIASKNGDKGGQKLADKNVELAFNFGVRFKLSPKLSLNTDLRGIYGFSDLRSEEFIASVKDGSASFDTMMGRRANVMVGLQLGLNYYIGF
jgi:hypothetical protein